mmetsp:Transcript_6387/g.18931  ORF Transcript_6387/g.18931 Transcript_6387/m.18931 type:complete len:279 (-) Transcript_6387:915-1751(-)
MNFVVTLHSLQSHNPKKPSRAHLIAGILLSPLLRLHVLSSFLCCSLCIRSWTTCNRNQLSCKPPSPSHPRFLLPRQLLLGHPLILLLLLPCSGILLLRRWQGRLARRLLGLHMRMRLRLRLLLRLFLRLRLRLLRLLLLLRLRLRGWGVCADARLHHLPSRQNSEPSDLQVLDPLIPPSLRRRIRSFRYRHLHLVRKRLKGQARVLLRKAAEHLLLQGIESSLAFLEDALVHALPDISVHQLWTEAGRRRTLLLDTVPLALHLQLPGHPFREIIRVVH